MTAGRRAVPVVASSIMVGVALTGCAKSIDHKDAERKIADLFAREANSKVTVACPSGKQRHKGVRFACVGTAADGSKADIFIRIVDDQGHFEVTDIRERKR
jgi:Domain of unknown function (DUF4333)